MTSGLQVYSSLTIWGNATNKFQAFASVDCGGMDADRGANDFLLRQVRAVADVVACTDVSKTPNEDPASAGGRYSALRDRTIEWIIWARLQSSSVSMSCTRHSGTSNGTTADSNGLAALHREGEAQ